MNIKMLDQYDILQVACDSSCQYPTNLVRTNAFSHVLESYRTRLQENEKSLFESKYHLIELVEAHDGDDAFKSTSIKSVSDLKKHFQVNRKDPKCRHAFIEAVTSRRPLDCSKEMLEYLLSFHQVSPSFLELVLAFRAGKQPEDFHYTSFRHESFLDQVNTRFAIFRLGRSGREIKQCYNLWSTEPSSGGSNPWSIRQTAVYHSFDVETGKAFWIDIKANSVIKSRIKDETGMSGNLNARNGVDLSNCFSATLQTHLIHFEWCRENWRHQLTSLEKRSSEILKKVLNAPVELLELTNPEISSDIGPNGETGGFEPGMGPKRRTTGASTIPKSILLPNFTKWGGKSHHHKPQATSVQSTLKGSLSSTQNDNVDGSSYFRFSEPFPIEQLQDLARIESTLQKINMVMKLNADVLLEILEYYQRLINDRCFPIEIKDGSSTAISDFFQQVRSIVNDLKREQCRIGSLLQVLSNGKSMYESILQFRNIEINTLFATNAHHVSLRMEKMTESMYKIAERTERETASMHIITLVTLIFLPGTFIAVRLGMPALKLRKFTDHLTFDQTFLGSGVFQWNQNQPGDMPTWKPEFFALFAKVCFPFMAVIGLIWICAYWWATRGRGKIHMQINDEESGISDGQRSSEKA